MKEKNPERTTDFEENVITSQGIILKIEPLSLTSKILANCVDIVLLLSIYTMIVLFIIQYNSFFILNSKSIRILYILSTAIVFFFLPMCIETLTKGASLGKFLIGAKVLREDGGRIYFRHALIRHLVGLVENYIFVGLLSSVIVMFNKKGKRLGDYFAGTYVAKTPDYISYLPLVMAPELKEWAKTVTISKIPDTLVKDAKSFINRANNFSTSARKNRAENIAKALMKYVDIIPEPNIYDNERFIASVLIIQRDKEFVKVLRTLEMVKQ